MTTERKYCVYKFTSPENKSYIGMTGNVDQRFYQHQRADSGCRLIRDAVQTYGWESIHKEILADNLDLAECFRKEYELIHEHNTTYPNGYNVEYSNYIIGESFEKRAQRAEQREKQKLRNKEAKEIRRKEFVEWKKQQKSQPINNKQPIKQKAEKIEEQKYARDFINLRNTQSIRHSILTEFCRLEINDLQITQESKNLLIKVHETDLKCQKMELKEIGIRPFGLIPLPIVYSDDIIQVNNFVFDQYNTTLYTLVMLGDYTIDNPVYYLSETEKTTLNKYPHYIFSVYVLINILKLVQPPVKDFLTRIGDINNTRLYNELQSLKCQISNCKVIAKRNGKSL